MAGRYYKPKLTRLQRLDRAFGTALPYVVYGILAVLSVSIAVATYLEEFGR